MEVCSLVVRKIFYAVQNSKLGHVNLSTLFSGGLIIRRLTLDTTYNDTKFDDSSFSHSRDIQG